MSVSTSLRASARAAYRDVLRASAVTFAGDAPLQNAFRLKIRNEILPNASTTDPKAFEEKITLTKEIADVLRKNIVQARRVENPSSEEKWQLRITEHTELGDNDSIKAPPPIPPKGSRRPVNETSDATDPSSSTSAPNNIPRFYSQLKKASKTRQIPEIREEDIEESFIRGSGPGGQSINKTENNVQLVHKPTGIRVTCQETRSLSQNRKIARKILLDKLDQLYNPGLSKQELLRAKQQERERRRKKKAKKKAKAKAAKEGVVEKEEDPDPEDAPVETALSESRSRDWLLI